MRELKFTLTILAIAGCWRPSSWTSLIKQTLYNAYALFIISLLCSFTFSQFMEMVLNVDNPDDFTEIMYTMMTMFITCYKILNLWVNQESVVALIQNLNEGLFKPLLPAEIEIRRKFDKLTQNLAMYYTVMIEANLVVSILISLLTNFRRRELPFKEWIPYDYSSNVLFCLTFFYQYASIAITGLINSSCDSLIIGLLLHLCCQISILKYRLTCITNDENILRNCIRHHHHIIEYAHAVNTRFTKIVAFQFVVSTFVVCSNLFQISKVTLSVTHFTIVAYTVCILVQIFIYCWFGNKLKLTSLQLVDSIFEIEWITLNNRIKKSLLVIMNRALVPIEFTSVYILNMNLDSFVALLKTSYSAYNLLVKMQEK